MVGKNEIKEDITIRIQKVIQVIQSIAGGNFSARAEVTSKIDIIDALAVGINMLAEELSERFEKLKRVQEKEKELAAQAAAAEIEKKKAEELRSVNQQLRASEQQLKAANQQLKANEQQLKAANQQLEAKEQTLRTSQEELKRKMSDLERFNRLMVGRELRMAELKKEIATLRTQNATQRTLKE